MSVLQRRAAVGRAMRLAAFTKARPADAAQEKLASHAWVARLPSPAASRSSELHTAMALELTYASDATLLLDDLVDSLGSPGNAAGVVVPVLMPSLPLVDRTKAALARRHGVAMGVAFLLPGAFIEHMAQLIGLDPLHPSWRPQGLAWRLVPLLAAMVEEGDTPRLGPACVDSRARHALARDVADRFDQYLYFRPEMIAAWDRGEAWDALPESAQGDEAWQRDLWRRLSVGLADHPHPAVRLRDLETRIHAGQGDVPTSLEVLASGPLPPTLLPLLRALATRTRVCLRALLPSTEYLGDLRAGRTQMRAGQAVDLAWEGHPPAVPSGQASRRQLSQFRGGTGHRRPGVRRHRAPRAPVGQTPRPSAGRHSRGAAAGCRHDRPAGHGGSFGACASLPRGPTRGGSAAR